MEQLNQQTHLETEEVKDIALSVDSAPEDSRINTGQVANESENLPDYGPIRVSAFGPNTYGDFHS